jgi:FtsH-binding integral membrane protein
MENFNFNNRDNSVANISQADLAKNFISNVFSWMGIALMITAVTSYYFGTNEELISMLVGVNGMTLFGWIVMLSPFAFVLAMSFGLNRMSVGTLTLIFGLFSLTMGMSLGFIFLAYDIGSIFKTFVVTAGMFGFMAFLGYTTKTDLTKFGSLLMMALFGLIIAMLVNFFMKSSTMDYVISGIGVLIFTGLTAYDVQKLKRIGAGIQFKDATTNKMVIMGALTLYLDFINLFLFLLRFLGNRR